MATMRMRRNGESDVLNPTIEDVHSLLLRVSKDDGESIIILGEYTSDNAERLSELWIAKLIDVNSGGVAGWLIRYKHVDKKQSLVLGTQRPKQAIFGRYEMSGVVYYVRQECVCPESAIDEAIQWFLQTGEYCPSLIWLDFRDSVEVV